MEVTAPSSSVGQQAQLPLGLGLPYTQRHVEILRHLDENRFVHTGQFQRLFGVDRVFRDLKILTDHGLIEQPKAQWVWQRVEGGGSRPRIHSLANPGAALLRKLKLSSRKRDWAELNRNLSPAWFVLNAPHELGVVDAHVSFLRGVAARPDHTLGTANTRAISIPGRERSIFPDKLLVAGREGSLPVVLPIEVDRSTMPNVRRAQPDLSYLGEKFATYHVYAYAGMPELEFGTPRFRVLTAVDGGEAKMRNVARTAFETSGGTAPDRFLVTSLASLREGDPFGIPWMNAAGEWVRLEV
jgi:Replication-relaxation